MELDKPKFKVSETFPQAINNFREATKLSLEKSLPAIINAEINYDKEATNGTVSNIEIDDLKDTLATAKQFEKTYTDKFAKIGHPARKYYDKIMIAPKASRCPYCGQRNVSTLDHYLDKKKYPKLTVTPYNLIPSCSDCNKTKLSDNPLSPSDYYIHPYYDKVDQYVWLHAKVIYISPLILEFYVSCDKSIAENMGNRIAYHFENLKLKALYTTEAINELNNRKYRLIHLFNAKNGISVKEYLFDEFKSYEMNNINSWQTAMFRALSEEERFYMHVTNWI